MCVCVCVKHSAARSLSREGTGGGFSGGPEEPGFASSGPQRRRAGRMARAALCGLPGPGPVSGPACSAWELSSGDAAGMRRGGRVGLVMGTCWAGHGDAMGADLVVAVGGAGAGDGAERDGHGDLDRVRSRGLRLQRPVLLYLRPPGRGESRGGRRRSDVRRGYGGPVRGVGLRAHAKGRSQPRDGPPRRARADGPGRAGTRRGATWRQEGHATSPGAGE